MHIGVLAPIPSDGTSWYRAAMPFQDLARAKRHRVTFITEQVDWHIMAGFDVVVLQRPMLPSHLQFGLQAKAFKIPVWVDFDDLQLNLPPWNAMAPVFNQEQCQNTFKQACAIADVVTVATSYLANECKKYARNVVVVPNAWPDRHLPVYDPIERKEQCVMWRTSDSQRADHHVAAEGIIPVVSEIPNVKIIGIGSPTLFQDYIPQDRFSYIPWQNPVDYFHTLLRIAPSINIKAMQDHPFNRAKSSIAWMEGAMAGAITVAPDWEEFRVPGVIRYNPEKKYSFRTALSDALIIQEKDRLSLVQSACKLIKEKYVLSKVNQQRQSILEGLCR